MAQISLFQIQDDRTEVFLSHLVNDYALIGEIVSGDFNVKLYVQTSAVDHKISWGWAFEIFGKPPYSLQPPPKGVLFIQRRDGGAAYATSFGASFFTIDKYADRDFAFNYASRLQIQETKRTATANSSSIRNKTISSFRKQTPLAIDSGESFTKIRAVFSLTDVADLIGDTIEVGTSLRFNLKQETLEGIIALITHVEMILEQPNPVQSIPRFTQIKDHALIEDLERDLSTDFAQQSINILISEFDVFGDQEVFQSADNYKIRIGASSKNVFDLNMQEIRNFASAIGVTDAKDILSGRVQFIRDGTSYRTTKIHDLLDYMDEAKKCLLVNGVWNKFNDDYVSYLHQALSDIPVIYNPDFDLTNERMNVFLQAKKCELRQKPEYAGKSDAYINEVVRKTYYREYCYNCMRQADGFELRDRNLQQVDGANVEIMDLYKDEAMFSVKIGRASSSLAYVVTQSSTIINLWRNHDDRFSFPLKKVGLWIVLDRIGHLTIQGNKLKWPELNMLLFKTQIDSWMKLARAAGLQPVIYLNYAEPRSSL